MSRVIFLGFLAAATLGCGGGASSGKLSSRDVTFTTIENAVEDLHATIHDPNYKSSGDMGSDSDRIGMALQNFTKAVEGKPVAADADEIGKKLAELDQLAASGAPVEKQREAVSALKATVAAAKAKL